MENENLNFKEGLDQDSFGNLKEKTKNRNLNEGQDQVSPGDLKEKKDEEAISEDNNIIYALIKKTLPIAKIENFSDFPDFVTPSNLESPLVIKDGDKAFCLDGWDKIPSANENVNCLVIEKKNRFFPGHCHR